MTVFTYYIPLLILLSLLPTRYCTELPTIRIVVRRYPPVASMRRRYQSDRPSSLMMNELNVGLPQERTLGTEDIDDLITLLSGSFNNAKQIKQLGRELAKQRRGRYRRSFNRPGTAQDGQNFVFTQPERHNGQRLLRRQEEPQLTTHQEGKTDPARVHKQQVYGQRKYKRDPSGYRQSQKKPYQSPSLSSSHLKPIFIRSERYRVSRPLNLSLNGTMGTIFFKEFTRRLGKPFKAGFYSFGLDSHEDFIRMRTHKLREIDLLAMKPLGRDVNGFVVSTQDLAASLGLKLRQNMTTATHPGYRRESSHERIEEFSGGAVEPDFDLAPSMKARLHTTESCDMLWKRLSPTTFVGYTVPECQGSLGAEQRVYVEILMTVTAKQLITTEDWYSSTPKGRLTKLKRSFTFDKLRDGGLFLSGRSKRADISDQSEFVKSSTLSTDMQPITGRFPEERHGRHAVNDIFKQSKQIKNTKSSPTNLNKNFRDFDYQKDRKRTDINQGLSWKDLRIAASSSPTIHFQNEEPNSMPAQPAQIPLRNFKRVIAALTSGFQVGFQVKLSECSGPSQAGIDRMTFGGSVKDFVYVRSKRRKGKRSAYVYFSSSKTIMTGSGPEYLTRQMTLYRGRRVNIKIIKAFAETSGVKQEFSYSCKLYNDRKGNGGVKLFIDPATQVTQIDSFDSFSTNLGKGHDLRLVINLSWCKGSHVKPATIMGTYVTDYDVVNGGRAIEVSLPVSDPSMVERPGWSMDRVVGHILDNGNVILTQISDDMRSGADRSDKGKKRKAPPLQLGNAYQCSLGSSDRDHEQQSVNVFLAT